MKKTIKKLLSLFVLLSTFIFLQNYNAQDCTYKDSNGNKITITSTGSEIKLDTGTVLVNKAGQGKEGGTERTIYAFQEYNMLNYNSTITCKAKLYEAEVIQQLEWYKLYILSDNKDYSDFSKKGAGITYINGSTLLKEYTYYNPVSGPTEPTTPGESCEVYKYNLIEVANTGSNGWQCKYNNGRTSIAYNGTNAYLKSIDQYDETSHLAKFTLTSIKKASDCPEYIWTKSIGGNNGKTTLEVYNSATDSNVKKCSIIDKTQTTSANDYKQICTFTNISNKTSKITLKATNNALYLNTGGSDFIIEGSEVGQKAASSYNVFYSDVNYGTICNNKFLFFKNSSISCSSTIYQNAISFSTTDTWTLNGLCTTTQVSGKDTKNAYYKNVYTQDPNYWENENYVDTKPKKTGNTDDLGITDSSTEVTAEVFCDKLFGSGSGRTKLYDIVHTLIFVIRIATPVILILMSMIDFTKATGDIEKMPKAKKNAKIRLIVAVIIFMLPALIKLTLTLVNLDSCNVF